MLPDDDDTGPAILPPVPDDDWEDSVALVELEGPAVDTMADEVLLLPSDESGDEGKNFKTCGCSRGCYEKFEGPEQVKLDGMRSRIRQMSNSDVNSTIFSLLVAQSAKDIWE